MIKGSDFLFEHADAIQKDVDAIIDYVNTNIAEAGGYMTLNWGLDHAPRGAVNSVISKVRKVLADNEWYTSEPKIDLSDGSFYFVIYP